MTQEEKQPYSEACEQIEDSRVKDELKFINKEEQITQAQVNINQKIIGKKRQFKDLEFVTKEESDDSSSSQYQ